MVGNHVVLKQDKRVAPVMEQFFRCCEEIGLDMKQIEVVNCSDSEIESLLKSGVFRMT